MNAGAGDAAVTSALLPLLMLEQLDALTFRNVENEDNQRTGVFGGQLLGQALLAACRTVAEGRRAHSLHAYFLRAGSPRLPLTYRVERLRDGGNFSSRRITAEQDGRAVFAMMASFHRDEEGIEHQAAMETVPAPETLLSLQELLVQNGERLSAYTVERLGGIRTVDIKPCDPQGYLFEQVERQRGSYWIRARQPLPADPLLHQCGLAYLSDYWLLGAALLRHTRAVIAADIAAVSLDHAIWFHREARIDEWLLYSTDSASANRSKGLVRGSLFDRGGQLLASIAQEGLIRIGNTR